MVNQPPQAVGGPAFTTTVNTELTITPAMLAAVVQDPDGDPLASVEVAAQPAGAAQPAAPRAQTPAIASVQLLPSGALDFTPGFKALGESMFSITAKDTLGAPISSVPVRVNVIGETLGGCATR